LGPVAFFAGLLRCLVGISLPERALLGARADRAGQERCAWSRRP